MRGSLVLYQAKHSAKSRSASGFLEGSNRHKECDSPFRMSFRSSFCSGVHVSGLSAALFREMASSTACCRSGVTADLGIRPRLLSREVREATAAPPFLKPKTAAIRLKPTAWSPKEVSTLNYQNLLFCSALNKYPELVFIVRTYINVGS